MIIASFIAAVLYIIACLVLPLGVTWSMVTKVVLGLTLLTGIVMIGDVANIVLVAFAVACVTGIEIDYRMTENSVNT